MVAVWVGLLLGFGEGGGFADVGWFVWWLWCLFVCWFNLLRCVLLL